MTEATAGAGLAFGSLSIEEMSEISVAAEQSSLLRNIPGSPQEDTAAASADAPAHLQQHPGDAAGLDGAANDASASTEAAVLAPASSWAKLVTQNLPPASSQEQANSAPRGYAVHAPEQRRFDDVVQHLQAVFTPVPVRPRGLSNPRGSNACFANSVLQCLLACPAFLHVFLALDDVKGLPPTTSVVSAFVRAYVADSASGREPSHAPRISESISTAQVQSSVPIPDHVPGRQEDAHEFLALLLDMLHEEMARDGGVAALSSAQQLVQQQQQLADIADNAKSGDGYGDGDDDEWQEVGRGNRMQILRAATVRSVSVVSDVFSALVRSEFQRSGAKTSVTVQPMMSIPLDVSQRGITSVQAALSRFAVPVSIQDQRTRASQTMRLEALPRVLILHLKRFTFDMTSGYPVKVDKHVEYPEKLQLPAALLSASAAAAGVQTYYLFAVLEHHGTHAHSGHYTCAVREVVRRSRWLQFDDENVCPISLASALDRQAYMLFYQAAKPTK